MSKQKIIIDLNHAFDVHFFRNFYFKLINLGYNVKVIISKKPHSYELIEELNIPHIKIGSYGTSTISKFYYLIVLNIKMLFIVLKFKPDYMFGHVSFRCAHIGWLLKIKNYIFTDTEHASEQISLFKPFATKIITPLCFEKNLGSKQQKINTIFELAYLHPNVFTPNRDILKKLNISISERYFILRFISWDATHDIGQSGLTIEDKRVLVNSLSKKGKVFISSEQNLEAEFEKYRIPFKTSEIHNAMAFCSLYIGEGATMASEAAVLGIPSIYVNSLNLGYISELEKKYELVKSLTKIEEILEQIDLWLNDKNLEEEFLIKYNKLLTDKEDPNMEMLKLII